YDLDSGRQVLRRATGEPSTYGPVLHPDGSKVAIGHRKSNEVRVLDLDSGRVLMAFPHPWVTWDVAWSPDGHRLAVACADRNAYPWDPVARGQPVILRGHEAGVFHVAFSHSGELLASAAKDRTTRLWDAATGELRVSAPCDGPLQFSPDDRRLAIASDRGSYALWEVAGGRECRSLWSPFGPRDIDFSPDGRLMVAVGGGGFR